METLIELTQLTEQHKFDIIKNLTNPECFALNSLHIVGCFFDVQKASGWFPNKHEIYKNQD